MTNPDRDDEIARRGGMENPIKAKSNKPTKKAAPQKSPKIIESQRPKGKPKDDGKSNG